MAASCSRYWTSAVVFSFLFLRAITHLTSLLLPDGKVLLLHDSDPGDSLPRIQDLLDGRLVQALLEDGKAALGGMLANPRMHSLPVLGNGKRLVDDVDAAKPPYDALGTMFGEVFQEVLLEGGLLLLELADLRLKFSTLLDEPIKLVGHSSGGGRNLRSSHSSLLCDFVPSTFNLRPSKIG